MRGNNTNDYASDAIKAQNGAVTLATPTVSITKENLNQIIDDMKFNFLLFDGGRAVEMTMYIPSKKPLVTTELPTPLCTIF